MNRILIAEDEAGIASFLEKGLRAEGFTTEVVDDGIAASERARDDDFDLLLLDLGLPGRHGLEVLADLRARGEKLPVVILTADDDTASTIAGLDGGADDYVVKPFVFREVLARIRARLRGSPAEASVLRVGDVTLDLHEHHVDLPGGKRVTLPKREFALAEYFMRNPDRVLSREELLEHVWGEEADASRSLVEVYVFYLRRKLGNDTIQTVRGKGYRLRAPGAEVQRASGDRLTGDRAAGGTAPGSA
jgi:two-component system, OmpR family, response regulator QseB